MRGKYMTGLTARNAAVILISVFVSVVLCDFLGLCDNEVSAKAVMNILLAATAAAGVYKLYTAKKITPEEIISLLIIMGLIIRIGYMIYTPWASAYGGRGYDEGALEAKGHYSYLLNWAVKGKLPDTNAEQFYQPPLNYFLSAVFIKIGGLLHGTADYTTVMKYAELVPCMATCVMLMVHCSVLEALKIKSKYRIPAVAMMAFFPNYLFLGGRINNDSLVALFMSLSVLYTLRWYYSRSMKNIVGIALSIGLGMMSKISCGTIAVFTGPVMLYVLYQDVRAADKEKIKRTVGQLAVFALICFPLGLWYPIRNYILFGQGLNYVQRLPESAVGFTGDVPWYQRFLSMPVFGRFDTGLQFVDGESSVFMMITQSAVFGSFHFDHISKIIRYSLYYLNLAVIIISLVSMFLVCKNDKKRDAFSRFSMLALWVIVYGSFIMFNISFPYTYTADVRYIPLSMLTGFAYISMAWELYSKKAKRAVSVCGVIIFAYCVMSVLFIV